jgi:hypothetical protein
MTLHQIQKHPEYVEGCFGCKVGTLELSSGDAAKPISEKKWQGELNAYRDARSQGIQPAGTSMKHIQEAHKASETLNKPYDANTMPKAKDINKKTVATLKHTGAI